MRLGQCIPVGELHIEDIVTALDAHTRRCCGCWRLASTRRRRHPPGLQRWEAERSPARHLDVETEAAMRTPTLPSRFLPQIDETRIVQPKVEWQEGRRTCPDTPARPHL